MPDYVPKNQVGRGSTLQFTPDPTTAVPSPTALTFPSIVSITPPALSVGEVSVELLASDFGPYLPTIPEAEGSVTVNHWDGDSSCMGMMAACNTAPVPTGTFLLTLPSGATFSWPGFPKKYAIGEVKNKELITAEIDYRQNAPWTYAAPPSGS